MIVSVAAVPHPPLLLPELVTGAVTDTGALRAACVRAAKQLAQAAPTWIAVSSGSLTCGNTLGTFRGYGVDVIVSLTADPAGTTPDPAMPLPLLVAAWLRGEAAADHVRPELVDPAAPVAERLALGERLAASEGEVGLLVLGDGSNRHPGPAGHADERAPGYDALVSRALAEADPEALLDLDPELAAELNVTGLPAWQVLAGVARHGGRRWRAELLYSQAPYGVGYHVAVWS
ncbi:hypothetical protein [Kutzneria albida]|uniref:hypothetical protein n=1 Tax=Kutzneria albida TaxID=43357 RepID=UPI00046D942A|nr:hypothetical protein [Kutzneria albida]